MNLKPVVLDAGPIFEMHRLNVWAQVVSHYSVQVSEIVACDEVQHYSDGEYAIEIDLEPQISDGAISSFTTSATSTAVFLEQFTPDYADRMDPGELESLTYCCTGTTAVCICSGDAIVYKTLGLLGKGELGLSVEELLQGIGISKKIRSMFGKSFRENATSQGRTDRIQGRGLKKSNW